MPLEALAPLLAVADVNFVVPQLEISTADADYLGKLPRITRFTRGFADTAAAIDGLDLVISVSIPALASSGGRPGRSLLDLAGAAGPDWRWLKDRTDTPWYPTARLFRQKDGAGWPPVIADLRDALIAFLGKE